MGVRLIAFDRPGYGDSDRQSGRGVAEGAADVSAIADALRLDRFAVLGRSGGGPHALACAALLPDRVTQIAVLVGLAETAGEPDPVGRWSKQMNRFNRHAYLAAERGADAVMTRLDADRFRRDPTLLVRELYVELIESDRRVLDDMGIRRLLVNSWAEGIRRSADGWIDDLLAFVTPWGFDLAEITTPTLIWHGADDRFSPAGHAQTLGERIPGCQVVIQPGRGHFAALKVMPDVISLLAHDHRGWNSSSPSIRRWALASAMSG